MTKKDETTKTVAKKPTAKTAKPVAVKKPRATAPKKQEEEVVMEAVTEVVTEAPVLGKPTLEKGKYIFATGRRKTAVANVRVFGGKGEVNINRKPLEVYFYHGIYRDTIMKPFQLTGLANDFHFNATINGGGIIAQAQALQHGIAQAIASMGDDFRKVLKKNGLLTRDDRKKERKKPGLRGARRAPQWAKR